MYMYIYIYAIYIYVLYIYIFDLPFFVWEISSPNDSPWSSGRRRHRPQAAGPEAQFELSEPLGLQE